MAILLRAPLLAVLGALVTAAALFSATGAAGLILLSPLLAVGLALCTYERKIASQWPVLLVLAGLTFFCALRMYLVFTCPLLPSRSVKTVGTVSLVRPWGRGFAAVIDTAEGSFLLRLHFAELTEGDQVKVEGVTRRLKSVGGRDGFDEERYWRARGVVARLSPSRLEPLPAQGWNLHRLRHRLSRALIIHMPPLTGAYLRAAWLGQRDEALGRQHRAWGTSHLLAVSGFHVGIVVLCAALLLPERRGNVLVLSAILWGYVLLTGAAPSALRAALMLQAAFFARVLGRPLNPVNSVSLAAVLLLVHSPFLFWDVGWRLSVLAAMTIAAMAGGGRFAKVRTWLLLSPLIALVTFPQTAYTFKGVPLAGVLLNFVAPTFFSAGFVLASAGAALRLLGLPLASWLLMASEGAFLLWGAGANGLAGLVPAFVPWGPLIAWLGAGALLLLLCRFMRLTALRTALLTTGGTIVSFLIFL